VPVILRTLREKLWIGYGSLPFSPDSGYSDLVSPFAGGFEVNARFAAGDQAGAYALLRSEWGHMITPGPAYTGAFWENFKPDGTVPTGATSLAHGWASGPTASLTEYVLGIQPIGPGYRTWRIAPHPGDLSFARGRCRRRTGHCG
jgi:alpha-L-rhamnosidase